MSLFLQYLSTGQFENARLVHINPYNNQIESHKQASLIACGFRPQDWVYTPSCPSFAHLSWLCARLIGEESKLPGPRISLLISSLLLEAGFILEEDSIGKPSVRAQKLISFLLSSPDDRLCNLLTGPSPLCSLLWEDIQPFLSSSKTDISEILTKVTDILVIHQQRYIDAAVLFALTKNEEEEDIISCPESLAKACEESEDTSYLVLLSLLKCNASKRKHASVFRYRKRKECTIQALILKSLRNEEKENSLWFSTLIEDPFYYKDTPKEILNLNLLQTTNCNDIWLDRLYENQELILVSSKNGGDFINKRNDLNNEERNPFAKAIQNRVNRLGFDLICAEILSGGKRDSKSFRIAHELRAKNLFNCILQRIPQFDTLNVIQLGTRVSPLSSLTEESNKMERNDLNLIRFCVWVGNMIQSQFSGIDEEIFQKNSSQLFSSFKSEERQQKLKIAVNISLSYCSSNSEQAINFINLVIKLCQGNEEEFLKELEQISCRIKFSDTILKGNLEYALKAPLSNLVIQSLEANDWDMALDLCKYLDSEELANEAKVGKDKNKEEFALKFPLLNVDEAFRVGNIVMPEDFEDTRVMERLNELKKSHLKIKFNMETLAASAVSTRESQKPTNNQENDSPLNISLESSEQVRRHIPHAGYFWGSFLTHLTNLSDFIGKTPIETLKRGPPLECIVENCLQKCSLQPLKLFVPDIPPLLILIEFSNKFKDFPGFQDLLRIAELENPFPHLCGGDVLNLIMFNKTQTEKEGNNEYEVYRKLKLSQQQEEIEELDRYSLGDDEEVEVDDDEKRDDDEVEWFLLDNEEKEAMTGIPPITKSIENSICGAFGLKISKTEPELILDFSDQDDFLNETQGIELLLSIPDKSKRNTFGLTIIKKLKECKEPYLLTVIDRCIKCLEKVVM